MATAPFDTPKAKETLIRFGFPEEQATGVVTMTRDAVLESVATKEDIADLKAGVTDLKAGVTDLKADVTDLKVDIAGLKANQKVDIANLKVDIADLKANQKADVADLKAESARLETRMVNRGIVAVGIIISVLGFITIVSRFIPGN